MEQASVAGWYRNLMPHRLRLRFVDGARAAQREVIVSPLGQIHVPETSWNPTALVDRGVLAAQLAARQDGSFLEHLIAAAIPASVLALVSASFANAGGWREFGMVGWPIVFGVIVFLLVAVGGGALFWLSQASSSKVRQVGLALQHQFMLWMVLFAACGVPILAVMLLAGDPNAWFGSPAARLVPGDSTGLGRILLLAFVCFASAFPGLLYFIFDRKRVDVIRETFEHQVFRLDRGIRNLTDVHARYGARLRELYGDAEQGTSASRLRFGTRWPVLIGTCAMAGGWVTVLLAPGLYKTVPTDDLATGMANMFTPIASNFSFGFLGAYFFSLQLIARRYARGDLHPKTYSMIAARIFVVLVSAWVIDVTAGTGPSTYALLFMIGVLPEAMYLALRELLAQRVFRSVFANITSRLPLTDLPGIDLYDRARLEEEGVTNIENLAHCDLVDLMLATNVPAPQLVQWVDQAILYLRARDIRPATALDEPGDGAPKEPPDEPLLAQLQRAGVVRASDLVLTTFDGCGRPTSVPNTQVLGSVGTICGPDAAQRAGALVQSIPHDQWYADIAYWRTWQEPAEVVYDVMPDGQVQESID